MIELAPLSADWRERTRETIRSAVSNALNSQLGDDINDKLRESQRVSFEITTIMSGNPRADSPILNDRVKKLEEFILEFENLDRVLEKTTGSCAILLLTRALHDLATDFRHPEVATESSQSGDEPMTRPMTKGEIGKLFSFHRNQVDSKVFSKYHNDKIGGKFRMRLADMPPEYHKKPK